MSGANNPFSYSRANYRSSVMNDDNNSMLLTASTDQDIFFTIINFGLRYLFKKMLGYTGIYTSPRTVLAFKEKLKTMYILFFSYKKFSEEWDLNLGLVGFS